MVSAVKKTTHVYKTVDDCEIKADVYNIDNPGRHPAIIFIHGGALIGGNRSWHPVIIEMLVNAGYVVVSIDYRLAPETKLQGIIEDIRDAIIWVRQKGPGLFNIDPNRIGVAGNSAGGYLTLMTGFVIDPPPKVLVSLYGYGDITGSWYTQPSAFYCQEPMVSESVARSSVGTKVISEVTAPNDRRFFYFYCRQNGLWPKEMTGFDPNLVPKAFDPFCPIRHVTKKYPPTMLLHGDEDTDVPYEESAAMATKLKETGINCQLVTLSGKGHSFDDAGLDDPSVKDALDEMLIFLKSHLSSE